ncbi:MAG: ATP-binding cassette domain-containing protein [Mycoplasmatales bacterium]
MTKVQVKNISKKFKKTIFENFSLEIQEGEFVVFKGESGKGKTTLLNLIGGLIEPDSGEILIDNQKISLITTRKGRKIFRNNVEYLFQNFLLLENKSVQYNLNIASPSLFRGYSDNKLKNVLKSVNLEGMLKEKVYNLSGGEQQRVVLARMLLKKSNIILCDEPTGSLDKVNAERIYKILKILNEDGKTIICVSHDDRIEKYASKIITL